MGGAISTQKVSESGNNDAVLADDPTHVSRIDVQSEGARGGNNAELIGERKEWGNKEFEEVFHFLVYRPRRRLTVAVGWAPLEIQS